MRECERAAAAAAERARVDIASAAAAAKKAAEERDAERRMAAAAKTRENRLEHEVRRLELQGDKLLQRLNTLLLQKVRHSHLYHCISVRLLSCRTVCKSPGLK